MDHLVPVKYGGTNNPSNLRVTHPACNLYKHARYICVGFVDARRDDGSIDYGLPVLVAAPAGAGRG